MDGIVLIDKPGGMTSHDVVRRLRRIFGMRRVGHTGTLDPMATGVLVAALGEGTRLVEFLMAGDKSYRATCLLGATTDTQDADGQILERRSVEGIDEAAVRSACSALVGKIEQIPPMYSALKKDGVPLYQLARQGVEIERKGREVEIGRIEILAIDLPYVELEIDCSKGTYIRTLCHDLGEALGCGAHLSALRRTRNGAFGVEACVGLETLAEQVAAGEGGAVLGLLDALKGYPTVEVNDEAAAKLKNGIPPSADMLLQGIEAEEGETVCLLEKGKLLAIAAFEPSRRSEKRGDFKLLRVFPGGA